MHVEYSHGLEWLETPAGQATWVPHGLRMLQAAAAWRNL